MIQQPFALPPHFTPVITPKENFDPATPVWWFVCNRSNLLTTDLLTTEPLATDLLATEPLAPVPRSLPYSLSLEDLGMKSQRTQFLGYLNGEPCIAAELAEETSPPDGFSFHQLRSLHTVLQEDLFAIAARATQLIAWDRNHQFCGHCATPMQQAPTERAKRCPNCNFRQYPRLSPAVIMLIYKGEDILLARAPRFREDMYSVLAGFVEPGESLEETVAREVREEVGIEIKNIRYFGSQPWPFPDSLMVGFTAEYASGEIVPEPTEIEAADWFHKSNLPPVPGKLSIARKLIDWFASQ